ncbi:MAG: ABC transporter ATP-binding protein/permease [Acidobacteriota bacterium]|nr:ABC transporter ATP-binding protein/permease [Acidobacteriota bacterium]
MKPLSRLLAYFRPYRWRAAAALAAMGIVSLSTVLLLFLLTKVIDDVLGSGAASAIPGFGSGAGETAAPFLRWLDSLYLSARSSAEAVGLPVRFAVPLLLVLALAAKNVFSYFSEFAFNGIGLSMVRDLRRDAYAKLLRQSASFYSRSSTGDLLSRLLSDVELIQSAFGTRLADFVQGGVTIALVLVYIVSLNARLSVFVLVLAPILLLPIIEVTRRLRRTTFSSRERIGEMGALLSETLRGHRVIKTYGMEPFEADRFARANDRYFRVTRRTVRIQALNSPMMEVIAGLGLAAIFVYAASQIRSGEMTVGGLISFLAALMMLYKPLKDVTKVNMALQLALSSARRVFELIDSPAEIADKPGAASLPPFAREIRYENVSFRYGEEPVLSNVDLTIRRGETVAIVGPSGAGKTTLVNLLPRLYDPTEGRVTLDGVDLRDATIESVRRQIGLVTQETVLFDTNARENVAYGRPEASEEAVRAASAAAFADEFVGRLPEGYETRLGEDAGRLSGGQKQRLSIARALYKDAPILILDEATSQLDSESEALVARALTNLMAGRTTLVIAHRLSTVRRADRILVLDRGRLVESGTHAELLTRNGLYRRLHDMQFFLETDAGALARP